MGVFGTQHLLGNDERPPVERLGVKVATLGFVERSQIIQPLTNVDVIRAVKVLRKDQSALGEADRLRVFSLVVELDDPCAERGKVIGLLGAYCYDPATGQKAHHHDGNQRTSQPLHDHRPSPACTAHHHRRPVLISGSSGVVVSLWVVREGGNVEILGGHSVPGDGRPHRHPSEPARRQPSQCNFVLCPTRRFASTAYARFVLAAKASRATISSSGSCHRAQERP